MENNQEKIIRDLNRAIEKRGSLRTELMDVNTKLVDSEKRLQLTSADYSTRNVVVINYTAFTPELRKVIAHHLTSEIDRKLSEVENEISELKNKLGI